MLGAIFTYFKLQPCPTGLVSSPPASVWCLYRGGLWYLHYRFPGKMPSPRTWSFLHTVQKPKLDCLGFQARPSYNLKNCLDCISNIICTSGPSFHWDDKPACGQDCVQHFKRQWGGGCSHDGVLPHTEKSLPKETTSMSGMFLVSPFLWHDNLVCAVCFF